MEHPLALETEGFVSNVPDVFRFYMPLAQHQIHDMVVLDLKSTDCNAPFMAGFAGCRRMRLRGDRPGRDLPDPTGSPSTPVNDLLCLPTAG